MFVPPSAALRCVIAINAFLVFGPSADAAPAEPGAGTLTDLITIRSAVLNEDRYIAVHRPGPLQEQLERYPVLYVLDGELFFLNAVGVMDFLSKTNRMPPMIVVGILNTDRSRDFSPPKSSNGSPFLRFLSTELFPLIEARYPTEPSRVIAGYSLAGSLVLHALVDRPELFRGYVAMSPPDDDALTLRPAGEVFSGRRDLDNKALYLGIGGAEDAGAKGAHARFVAWMRAAAPPRLRFTADELAGEDHSSVRERFLQRGLARIFEGWDAGAGIPSVETLPDALGRYGALSERFGFVVKPPERVLREIGQGRLRANDVGAAVAAFRAAVDAYPASPLAHAELGEALEKTGAIAQAREELQKAVRAASGGGFAATFEQRLAAFEARVSRRERE